MQITHEEARRLIQFNAEDALNAEQKDTLALHLQSCVECRTYVEEIKEVESILLPVMKRQWELQPIPLSIAGIRGKRNPKMQTNIILATRTAAIGIVFLAFIFSIWQFTVSAGSNSSPLPMSLPPVPTPSMQSTSTKTKLQNCAGMLYTVEENDTLESIASRFSISREEIMAANNLKTETVNASMELVIPVCNFTPTGTINPTTLTTTYTPLFRPATSTPGG